MWEDAAGIPASSGEASWMNKRFKRVLARSVVVAAIAALLPVASTDASTALPDWIMDAPFEERATILSNLHKAPPEFMERLRYARDDGTVAIMGTLIERTSASEAMVRSTAQDLQWYGRSPAFYGRVNQSQMARLLSSTAVMFVEPDFPITNFLSTASVDVSARSLGQSEGMWSYDPSPAPRGQLRSNVPGFSADRVTGKEVVVGHLDSGIDGTHRDFSGWECDPAPLQPCDSRILRKVIINQVAGNDNDEVSSPTTDFASGHGTHTAGIIAGNGLAARQGDNATTIYGGDGYNFGIAPQADLVSIKIGDTQSAGLGVAGLQWQLAHARKYNIRVSNNSWGCRDGCSFDPRSALALILKRLYEEEVLTVFSAGNSGGGPDGAALSGYSSSPYVLGVAAYADDGDKPTLADFSSRGEATAPLPDPATWTPESEITPARRPDLAAPGVRIYSAANLTGGTSSLIPRINPHEAGAPGLNFLSYTFMSGTSMSAPMVSGAAAILIGGCPTTSTLDIMRSLMAGAQTRTVWDTNGSPAPAYATGYGGLNVRASLDWLLQQGVCSGPGTGQILKPVIKAPEIAVAKQPLTLQASVAGNEAAEYTWNLGDGTQLIGDKVTHSFAKPGHYEIQVVAQSGEGAIGSSRTEISVSGRPSHVLKGHARQGTYIVTAADFIFNCHRGSPQTQGVDGHVFALPDPVPSEDQVATLSAKAKNGAPVELYASVYSHMCSSTDTAYTEGSHRLTVAAPLGTKFIVGHVKGPSALDIRIDLTVHKQIPR